MGEEQKLPEFGGIRKTLWPIYKFELKKFLPMGFMMIFILFVYTLCRDLKDTLLQTRIPNVDTEIISNAKIFGVIPFSIIFTIVFMKLSNKYSTAKMFYGTITFFVGFFVLFGFLLYPATKTIHGSPETTALWQEKLPKAFNSLVPLITNWTFTLAYIFAELWGTAVISLLFWQFANDITKTTEAPRFYSLFGMIGNLGLIGSGDLVTYFAKKTAESGDVDVFSDEAFRAFGSNLKWQMFFVGICGVMIILIYRWMQKNVLTDAKLYTPGGGIKKKAKPKMSVGESFMYIIKNPYVMLIAALVFTYGMSLHLDEVLWKSQIKAYYPNPNDYNAFMGGVSKRTGIATVILMIIGTNILSRCKWRTSALVTPVFTLVTSIVFFGLLIYKEKLGADAISIEWLRRIAIFKGSWLWTAVWVGMYQVSLSKGIKYSLFDSTKNMAYMPLDPEEKLKSQAAVEVIGGRLGKGGGATLVWILTSVIFPKGTHVTNPTVMRIVMCLAIAAMLLWIIAVFGINPKVEAKLAEKRQEEKEAKEAAKA